MNMFAVIGDALWILALALMAGASRQALRRTAPGAKVLLLGARVGRWAGFCAIPVVAFLASLWLSYAARLPQLAGDMAMLLLGVRGLSASLFALLHLRALSTALRILGREGQLKP